MVDNVSRVFQTLELQKRALLDRIAAWPTEQRQFRPAPGRWSALDIVDHLVRMEETALVGVQTNLPHGHPVRIIDRLSGMLVNGLMRSPIRIRVPAGVPAVLPDGAADLDALGNRWAEIRKEMASLLCLLAQEQLHTGLVRHPVAGWMSILQGMRFLSAHLIHHEYQLDRLERTARR